MPTDYLQKIGTLIRNPLKAKYIPSFLEREFSLWRGKKRAAINNISCTFTINSITEYNRINGFMNEKEIIKSILSETEEGDVFYDIGANVGTHSVFVGSIPEVKVYSFEPFLANFESLKRNFGLNSIKGDAFQVALMNENSKMSLTEESGDAGEGTSHISDKGNIEVETFKGDTLIHERDLKSADVMKIDVEGAEFEVLKGFKKTLETCQSLKLFIELHPERMKKFEGSDNLLIDFLKNKGFNIERIAERGGEYHIKAKK